MRHSGWIALASLLLATSASAASSLQPVYDAALRGDMTLALAILDTVDTSGWTAKDSVAASCLQQTFRSPPRDEDLPPGSKAILKLYREYWQDTMLRRKPIPDAERQLLAELNQVLPPDSVASDLDTASERIKTVIRSEGLIGLTGVTSPFYELMLWKSQTASTYRMKLPEETVRVTVVFLDEFVSLGWAGYATCDRAHSGGWATQDSLYAVRSAYNVGTENFRVSYLSHEGQHFADYKRYPKLAQPELEYRAKLTEIAVSDSTTYDLVIGFARRNGTDRSVPHHFANYWVSRDLSREVLGSDFLVTEETRWKSAPAGKLRSAAARLLKGSSSRLKKLGRLETSQFLESSPPPRSTHP